MDKPLILGRCLFENRLLKKKCSDIIVQFIIGKMSFMDLFKNEPTYIYSYTTVMNAGSMNKDYICFERMDNDRYLFDGMAGYVYLLNETGSIIAENIPHHNKKDTLAQLMNEYEVNKNIMDI